MAHVFISYIHEETELALAVKTFLVATVEPPLDFIRDKNKPPEIPPRGAASLLRPRAYSGRLPALLGGSGGVSDYILVSPGLEVLEAWCFCQTPRAEDPTLYPSDHVGVAAKIRL